jgi:hypothetical protein
MNPLCETIKTSQTLIALESTMQRVRHVSEQIHILLEDDARIEDLQDLYKDVTQSLLANVILQYHNSILRAHPMVQEKCRVLVDMVEGLYRLVK